jgi:hypothetical protein
MGQVFLTVYDNKGRPVLAKTLVDAAGNDVISPRTGQPLIVPRDYDVNAAIVFGRSLNNLLRLPFNEELAVREILKTYEAMYRAFKQGGPQDLQRSYNGMVGGGGNEFVKDFEDAASFNLGVVGRAAGLSPDEITLAGGAYNLWNRIGDPTTDTSGRLFNRPDNVKAIGEGVKAHDSGRFFQRTPMNEPSEGGVQVAAGSANAAASPLRDASIVPGQQVPPPRTRSQQTAWSGQPAALPPNGSPMPFGLPQPVIDAGNYLRANGFEITPRSMYVASVLGPQRAVDLFNRTGSTSSDEVPSPDAATGRQVLSWVRALRLGPAAAGAPPTPDFGQSGAPSFAAQPAWTPVGAASQNNNVSDDAGLPVYGAA